MLTAVDSWWASGEEEEEEEEEGGSVVARHCEAGGYVGRHKENQIQGLYEKKHKGSGSY